MFYYSVDGSVGDTDRDGGEHRYFGDGNHRVCIAGRGQEGVQTGIQRRYRPRHVQLAHRCVTFSCIQSTPSNSTHKDVIFDDEF